MHAEGGALGRLQAQQLARRPAVAVQYASAWRQLHVSCRRASVRSLHDRCPARRAPASARATRAGSSGAPLDGPLATYQGSAQAPGLLKARSQDYFANIELDVDVSCSQSWLDEQPRVTLEGCGDFYNRGGAAMVARTAAGAGSAGAPLIVVTGVFDGHGGEMSARYAQEAVLSYIANDCRLHKSLGSGDTDATSEALKAAFSHVDLSLLALAASSATEYRDGTTALVTVQAGGLLAVANAGDSRAVLCRGGQALRLSRDHTPALRGERERIEAAGGRVAVARGAARVLVPLAGSDDVMQALAVSRSLGDPDFKVNGFVISEPDVAVVSLLALSHADPADPGASAAGDAFIIAASDGLWGRVADQEAVDCVAAVLAEYASMSSPNRSAVAKAAARRLVQLALDCGSTDDVTVVVSVFHWG